MAETPFGVLCRGRVRLFGRKSDTSNIRLGFIFQQEEGKGKPDVYFDLDTYCEPVESSSGELELKLWTKLKQGERSRRRIPREKEWIVYIICEVPGRNPIALKWTFADMWDEARGFTEAMRAAG